MSSYWTRVQQSPWVGRLALVWCAYVSVSYGVAHWPARGSPALDLLSRFAFNLSAGAVGILILLTVMVLYTVLRRRKPRDTAGATMNILFWCGASVVGLLVLVLTWPTWLVVILVGAWGGGPALIGGYLLWRRRPLNGWRRLWVAAAVGCFCATLYLAWPLDADFRDITQKQWDAIVESHVRGWTTSAEMDQARDRWQADTHARVVARWQDFAMLLPFLWGVPALGLYAVGAATSWIKRGFGTHQKAGTS